MYHMKNIVPLDGEVTLPKCMYSLKKISEPVIQDETEINIRNQVNTFLKQAPAAKMTELEERQDLLLKKLDNLYDRIKIISSQCKFNNMNLNAVTVEKTERIALDTGEIVIVLSPDNLPWFLNIYLKQVKDISVSWHIHSSVSNEKKAKIQAFFRKFHELYATVNSKINIRLIFKPVAADSELRLSSLEIPIVGNVNVLRYLAVTYPTVAPYDWGDYQVDSLLDLCCLLERSLEKNKEELIKKIFLQQNIWIHKNQFSIVDVAVYNILKQWQNGAKYVPKTWFEKCEKTIM